MNKTIDDLATKIHEIYQEHWYHDPDCEEIHLCLEGQHKLESLLEDVIKCGRKGENNGM